MTDPTEAHGWLTIDFGLGDTRLPIELVQRLDGLTLMHVGHPDVMQYDTMLDIEQLSDFIEMLTIMRDCAVHRLEAAADQGSN